MLPQEKLLATIFEVEEFLDSLLYRLADLDQVPRQNYNKSLDSDMHNLLYLSWDELTEPQRNKWRGEALRIGE